MSQAYNGNLSTTDHGTLKPERLHIAKLSKEKKKENETNCQAKKPKHPKQLHKIHNTIYIKHQKNRYVLVLVRRKT